ncbi:hypothetical protein PtA15_5A308 [Puccinia triticina]|uniref:Uncharacterized protein n=1 Tax=Puccinia triticina TaxID=208348 RepID=A0ABY7CJ21_9BASI|nr:uncharacterized protein PtA15_5A308 [Puccinia triticina]WAQ84735.1 hypothetical protein PtA15_5A308 [Puccinia triticina]
MHRQYAPASPRRLKLPIRDTNGEKLVKTEIIQVPGLSPCHAEGSQDLQAGSTVISDTISH